MYRLDHIQLAIPEGAEEACRAFWSGLLGFEELEKPVNLRHRGGCRFARDGVEVHLGVETPFAAARKAHPAFGVYGLDDLADAMAKAGQPVRWDESIMNRRRFFTTDPVGNRIEFLEK